MLNLDFVSEILELEEISVKLYLVNFLFYYSGCPGVNSSLFHSIVKDVMEKKLQSSSHVHGRERERERAVLTWGIICIYILNLHKFIFCKNNNPHQDME